MHYDIDATNQALGRLASKIAFILRGKNLASFNPSELPTTKVNLLNIKKARFTGLKLDKKMYHHYSGYHSGIKSTKLSVLWETKPKHVIRQMVYRMLPKNKQRDLIIKNLVIK